MKSNKKINIETLILKLLTAKLEINLQDVAHVAGLDKSDEGDRKAIRRVLNALVKDGLLETKGAARARVYIRTSKAITSEAPHTDGEIAFKEIELSKESKVLLKHISKPIAARTPVGYNQEFLRSYRPNITFYLSEEVRAELMGVGKNENKMRPAGTYARNILSRLLIDLSWNSSRLEGNTYSLLETKRLIELGENALGKNASEAQMILNHKGAIEYIVESASEEKTSSHKVCSIHALLSENLLGDPSASGRVREIIVGISGTTYIPLENPHILKECFQLYIKKMNLIKDPFEQSFFSLVHLSYIQAFEDINKRTARLVANIPLIKKNLRPLSFTDVNLEAYIKSLLAVYEKNDISLLRDLYVWTYKRSSQRYSAIQQSMGEQNLLKLRYRNEIKNIIRTIILEKVPGPKIVHKIQSLIQTLMLPEVDATEIFKIIETEILSLHENNIARFRIRPSEFQNWKNIL